MHFSSTTKTIYKDYSANSCPKNNRANGKTIIEGNALNKRLTKLCNQITCIHRYIIHMLIDIYLQLYIHR